MMMRSIAGRLAFTFALVALAVFALADLALYQALSNTLSRQQDEDLRGKLEVVERLIGEVRTVERWDALRNTLTTITTTDGNTRFWIACENTALQYGGPFPDPAHPRYSGAIKTLQIKDIRYPMKTMGKTLRPLPAFPEIHLVVGIGTEPVKQTLRSFAIALAVISLFGIACVAGLGFWIAGFGLQPLIRLSEGAKALSPRNLSQRLHLTPPVSELTPLESAFNGALDRLETAYAQLEGFSADVAHELRTPIGNIIGTTQVALTRDRTPEELRETLESNLEELERLRAIVNDMLFLARADQGEIASSLTQVSIADEIGKTVEFLEPLLEEKNIRVMIDGDGTTSVDKALLRRAVINLLHNAINYSPNGTQIRVGVCWHQGQLEIAVSNPGEAIAEQHLSRLFDRFYRVDPSRSLSSDNHGLGLAIVKAIAKMHRGTVFARSENGMNTIGLTLQP
jgi:two-component system heavy metal sensor histidine kinase CusS